MKREPTKGEHLLKTATFAVKRSDDAKRMIEHVITARTVDRDGDVVEPKGIRTENFRKNPVVLLGHSSWGFPVGRCLGLAVTADEIVAQTEFAGLDQAAPEAETAYRLARDGFMNAWSIGFMPITWSEDKALPTQDGWWFKETELYEYSLVAIPSNPEALSRFAKGLALPNGASEADFLDAVKKDRKRYFDVGAALLVGKDTLPARQPIGTLVERSPRNKAMSADVSNAILAALSSIYVAVVASLKSGDEETADSLSTLADSLMDVASQEPETAPEPAPAGDGGGWPTEPTPDPAGPTITAAVAEVFKELNGAGR